MQPGSQAFRWLGVLVISSSRSRTLPGQASRAAYHHLISSLGKIQKHSYSATKNFWLVRFWQMFLLAVNYFSCLSFCLSSHPLCLLAGSRLGAILSISRQHQAPSLMQARRLQSREGPPLPEVWGEAPALTTGPRGAVCIVPVGLCYLANGTVHTF